MIPLGKATLLEGRGWGGIKTKSWDLTPFGGEPVFLGPVTMPLPTGTLDKGNLRIELQTGQVWQLQPGDPKPSLGKVGATVDPKWLLGAGLLGLFAGFSGLRSRRRR